MGRQYYNSDMLLDELLETQEILAATQKALAFKETELAAAQESLTKIRAVNANLNRRIANLVCTNEMLVEAYNQLSAHN